MTTVAPRGKFDYKTVTKDQLPSLAGKGDEVFKKVKEFGELVEAHPPFPETREYKDCGWAIAFILVFLAYTIMSLYGIGEVGDAIVIKMGIGDTTQAGIADTMQGSVLPFVLKTLGVSGGSAILASMLFIHLGRICPTGLVLTSVLFLPVVWSLAGVGLFVNSSLARPDGDALALILGLNLLPAVLFWVWFLCWGKKYVPMSAELVRVGAVVLESNFGVLAVGVTTSLLSAFWYFIWIGGAIALPFLIFREYNVIDSKDQTKVLKYTVPICIFVLYWVMNVFQNVCHTTYCGVFGRWYYKMEATHPVTSALKVSLTTSLGSIACLGFMVAFVRTLQTLANNGKRNSRGTNPVACVIMCIMECLLRSLADMLEYFNSWALVLCANRGVGAIDAVKMTWALATLANLRFISGSLMINAVVNMGSVICGLVAALGAALTSGTDSFMVTIMAGLGFVIGFTIGQAILSVFDSASKTIMYGWCQDADRLKEVDQKLESDITEAVTGGYSKAVGYRDM